MNIKTILATALTASLCCASVSANEDNYVSLQLSQVRAMTVSGERPGGYWVVMSQAVSPDYGILAHQSWDSNDIDDNWYQIYSEVKGKSFCLSVVPSEEQELDTVVVLNACVSGNLGQSWKSVENGDTARLHNASTPGECLTGIPSGEHKDLLTMTTCGSGDVSTELWEAVDTYRPHNN